MVKYLVNNAILRTPDGTARRLCCCSDCPDVDCVVDLEMVIGAGGDCRTVCGGSAGREYRINVTGDTLLIGTYNLTGPSQAGTHCVYTLLRSYSGGPSVNYDEYMTDLAGEGWAGDCGTDPAWTTDNTEWSYHPQLIFTHDLGSDSWTYNISKIEQAGINLDGWFTKPEGHGGAQFILWAPAGMTAWDDTVDGAGTEATISGHAIGTVLADEEYVDDDLDGSEDVGEVCYDAGHPLMRDVVVNNGTLWFRLRCADKKLCLSKYKVRWDCASESWGVPFESGSRTAVDTMPTLEAYAGACVTVGDVDYIEVEFDWLFPDPVVGTDCSSGHSDPTLAQVQARYVWSDIVAAKDAKLAECCGSCAESDCPGDECTQCTECGDAVPDTWALDVELYNSATDTSSFFTVDCTQSDLDACSWSGESAGGETYTVTRSATQWTLDIDETVNDTDTSGCDALELSFYIYIDQGGSYIEYYITAYPCEVP